MNLREIGAGQLIHGGPHFKLRLAWQLAAVFGFWERLVRHWLANIQASHRTFDFHVAFVDTLLIEIVEGKRLLEREYMLRCVFRST